MTELRVGGVVLKSSYHGMALASIRSTYPSWMWTLSMMTQLVILHRGPILQLAPITDCRMLICDHDIKGRQHRSDSRGSPSACSGA